MVSLIAQVGSQQNQYFVRSVLPLWQGILWKHSGTSLNLAGSRNLLQMKAHNSLSKMRVTGLKQPEIRLGFYGLLQYPLFRKFCVLKHINKYPLTVFISGLWWNFQAKRNLRSSHTQLGSLHLEFLGSLSSSVNKLG